MPIDFVASENFKRLPPTLQILFRGAAEFLIFDYSTEQWAEIAKSFQALHAEPDAVEKARVRLVSAARSYYLEDLNRPGRKQQNKWRIQHWVKAFKLADALGHEFNWLARDQVNNAGPAPDGKEPYDKQRAEVMQILLMARSNIVNLGGEVPELPWATRDTLASIAGDPILDGFPNASPKSLYHSAVLEVWTELGGKLKISRHPNTHKTKGPLARYFSAVTQPVHGGSPESLHGIIERHVERQAALKKWRLELETANTKP
jgi:hypothetical protein